MTDLQLGGRVPFTTVDMPGLTAAVFFCQGCPWRCRYCHNPHLQKVKPGQLSWKECLDWLEPRRGFLEAVVFSGGEPTAQPGLPQAVREVKAMGFRVGLHTAGCHPGPLEDLLPLLDWVGLDIKAGRGDYSRITRVPGSGETAWDSLGRVVRSGVPFEVRTTVHPDLLSEPDLARLAQDLDQAGAVNCVLQPFRAQGCLDEELLGPAGVGVAKD